MAGVSRTAAAFILNVTAWFVETVKQYDLLPAWVYYDSYSARYFVEEMQMQGFNMIRCIQGAKTLSLPMQMLGADLQAHKVIYNNNPVLKWCLTNTGIQTDRNGNIVPIKNQSLKQRIDGTAALLDCYVGLYELYNEYTTAIYDISGTAMKLKDKRKEIQESRYTTDKYGNHKKELVTIATVWAYFRQLSGNEIYRVTTQTEETVLFQIGYGNDLTTANTIVYKGKTYNIARIDVFEGYKSDLVLYCKTE